MKVKQPSKEIESTFNKKENHMKKALSVLVLVGILAGASAGMATETKKAESKKAETKKAESAPAKK